MTQDALPEPIHNVFDNPDAPAEEKTIAPVGPANEVPMLDTTILPPNPATVSAVEEGENKDTRAPVGLDAGAPQVTDEAMDEGGWHGGAEEQGGGKADDVAGGAKPEEAPVGAQVAAPPVELGLDEEQKRLALEAMRHDEEM